MDELKGRLRALRESRGYSQKGLATRLDCSPSLISSYETGERSPSLQNLGELADCFGVTTDYLLRYHQPGAAGTACRDRTAAGGAGGGSLRPHRGAAHSGGDHRSGHAPAEQ